MSATTLSASFGGIAGSDLEAELAQPRTVMRRNNGSFLEQFLESCPDFLHTC